MNINRSNTIHINLTQITPYIDSKWKDLVTEKIKFKLTDFEDSFLIDEVFKDIIIHGYIFLKDSEDTVRIIKTINNGYPIGKRISLNKQFLDTHIMNTLLLIPYDNLQSYMTTEHLIWEPVDEEAVLKDVNDNNTEYQVCLRLAVLTNDEIDSIENNDGMKIQACQRSQEKNFRPKASTKMPPGKMRKALKKSMVVIFDKYVHMTIKKDEAKIWRFFDTFEDQEAFYTFTDNMIKYLEACRIKTIQLCSDDVKKIETTNIDDYIAELLDTNDIDELVLILGSIDERQLGDIKMETRLLINHARQKVTAYLH